MEARKALIIGIDNYPSFPLESCVSDAKLVANLLETHSDDSPNFEVKTLLSSEVSIKKGELKKEITQLFAGDPDVVLFYFSGHGYLNEYGGYLVTPDFERYDEGVSMSEILTIANNSKAKNKIIILDCCFSGAFAKPMIQGTTISELSDGLTVMTSSSEYELATENEENGLFSSFIINALQGECADLTGKILPSSVYAYVDRALGYWGGQRPIFKTNISRMVSLRNVQPPVDLKVLRNIVKYFSDVDHLYQSTPSYEPEHQDATPKHTKIFSDLQKMVGVGLVKPVGEAHMYFAAINSKACKLTLLGRQYWKLVNARKV